MLLYVLLVDSNYVEFYVLGAQRQIPSPFGEGEPFTDGHVVPFLFVGRAPTMIGVQLSHNPLW